MEYNTKLTFSSAHLHVPFNLQLKAYQRFYLKLGQYILNSEDLPALCLLRPREISKSLKSGKYKDHTNHTWQKWQF